MKIALYTGSALPKIGGQELVVDALARQFQSLGHDVTMIAPMPRRPLRPDDAALPYRVVRHPRFYSTKIGVSWYRWFLRKAHRQLRFDIVHCHDVYPTGYLAALLKEHLRVPIVITSHGGDVKEGNVRLRKRGMEARFVTALRGADAIVSIGKFTEEGIARLSPSGEKVRYIPNGVDLLPFEKHVDRPAEMDTEIKAGEYMLFIGRLKDRKGIDVLLDAMAMLPPRGGVELVVAGEGEERENIDKQIDRQNLRSRVRLVGRASGDLKVWLLQNAKFVVMPSRVWEAFPLVVLEAYAAGKPVIGSDIPGLRDLVKLETGLLVPEENPKALADAIAKLLGNPVLIESTGKTAADIARGFAWPEVARQHIALYESCIARRPL